MRYLIFNLVLAFVLSATASMHANEVFISFSDFGDGNADSNSVGVFQVGDTGTAFLWIDASSDIGTLAVTDVLLSNATVAALSGSVVFNPDILLMSDSSDVGDRWDDFGNGTVSTTGDAISGMFGFSSGVGTGPTAPTGIRMDQDGTGTQVDQLFDPSSSAFLFAQVDFVANERGTVLIEPQGIFLNGGVLDNFEVTSGTIIVVPEPSISFALVLTIGVAASRRRR